MAPVWPSSRTSLLAVVALLALLVLHEVPPVVSRTTPGQGDATGLATNSETGDTIEGSDSARARETTEAASSTAEGGSATEGGTATAEGGTATEEGSATEGGTATEEGSATEGGGATEGETTTAGGNSTQVGNATEAATTAEGGETTEAAAAGSEGEGQRTTSAAGGGDDSSATEGSSTQGEGSGTTSGVAGNSTAPAGNATEPAGNATTPAASGESSSSSQNGTTESSGEASGSGNTAGSSGGNSTSGENTTATGNATEPSVGGGGGGSSEQGGSNTTTAEAGGSTSAAVGEQTSAAGGGGNSASGTTEAGAGTSGTTGNTTGTPEAATVPNKVLADKAEVQVQLRLSFTGQTFSEPLGNISSTEAQTKGAELAGKVKEELTPELAKVNVVVQSVTTRAMSSGSIVADMDINLETPTEQLDQLETQVNTAVTTVTEDGQIGEEPISGGVTQVSVVRCTNTPPDPLDNMIRTWSGSNILDTTASYTCMDGYSLVSANGDPLDELSSTCAETGDTHLFASLGSGINCRMDPTTATTSAATSASTAASTTMASTTTAQTTTTKPYVPNDIGTYDSKYFVSVTLPAMGGILIALIILLCCIRIDSPLCKICAEGKV